MTYREEDWIWLKHPSKPVLDYWRALNEDIESLEDFTPNDLTRTATFGLILLQVKTFHIVLLYQEGQRLGVKRRRRN